MSILRRTPSGLLVTLLLLTALSPLATVQAQPAEASEYYYGVEYDWTSLDSDLENLTGLDIQELFIKSGRLINNIKPADDKKFSIVFF